MNISLLSEGSKSEQTLPLPASIIERGHSPIALHHAVHAELANRRMGTASTKERSSVTGSNIKPWRQKGTGRARAGSRQSPIWRGGGVVFGPQPRSYRVNVPRKQRVVALCSALCRKAKEDTLFVIDPINIAEVKTKLLSEVLTRYLRTLEVAAREWRTVLIVIDDSVDNAALIRRAGGNIPYLTIQHYTRLSLHTLFYSDYTFVYKGVIDGISASVEATFRKKESAA